MAVFSIEQTQMAAESYLPCSMQNKACWAWYNIIWIFLIGVMVVLCIWPMVFCLLISGQLFGCLVCAVYSLKN